MSQAARSARGPGTDPFRFSRWQQGVDFDGAGSQHKPKSAAPPHVGNEPEVTTLPASVKVLAPAEYGEC